MTYDDPRGYEVEAPVDLSRNTWSLGPRAAIPSAPTEPPAAFGWRGRVRRLTGGLVRPAPGAGELRHRRAEDATRRPVGEGRVVMVANPKGGTHRTTTALLLGSVFGRLRGGGVVVWDNHDGYGNLGRRAEVGEPGCTVRHLLAERGRRRPSERMTNRELARYLRHQPSGYELLAGDGTTAPLTSADCGWVGSRLGEHFELVIMDTGADHRTAAWQWAARFAGQLVIPLPLRADAALAAAWLCDYLDRCGRGALVRTATVVAMPAPADPVEAERILAYFARRTGCVVRVPVDPAIAAGAPVGHSRITEASWRAWVAVAATVADRLAAGGAQPGVVLPVVSKHSRSASLPATRTRRCM